MGAGAGAGAGVGFETAVAWRMVFAVAVAVDADAVALEAKSDVAEGAAVVEADWVKCSALAAVAAAAGARPVPQPAGPASVWRCSAQQRAFAAPLPVGPRIEPFVTRNSAACPAEAAAAEAAVVV